MFFSYRQRIVFLSLLFSSFLLLFSLSSGNVGNVWQAWWEGQSWAGQVLWELRLPRALTAFVCGGLLSLAGLLMQTLLRNPLADPYILGVSGGASVAALVVMLLGFGSLFLSISAFIGALFSMSLVFVLARGLRGRDSSLILTGVVIAAGWSAIIALLLALSPEQGLHGMLYWLMGDLGRFDVWQMLFAAVLLVAVLLWVMTKGRQLNVLSAGHLTALSLGVSVKRLRWQIYFLASLLTAAAVAMAGNIGFIGLIVPHIARLLLGSDHRWNAPVTVLLGGGLLVLADTLSRIVLAPQQLPVGVLTALIGVPSFLWLLHRSQSKGSQNA